MAHVYCTWCKSCIVCPALSSSFSILFPFPFSFSFSFSFPTPIPTLIPIPILFIWNGRLVGWLVWEKSVQNDFQVQTLHVSPSIICNLKIASKSCPPLFHVLLPKLLSITADEASHLQFSLILAPLNANVSRQRQRQRWKHTIKEASSSWTRLQRKREKRWEVKIWPRGCSKQQTSSPSSSSTTSFPHSGMHCSHSAASSHSSCVGGKAEVEMHQLPIADSAFCLQTRVGKEEGEYEEEDEGE